MSLRRWLDIVEGSHDHLHQDALDKTGFWGKQGAGCLFLARSTGRLLINHRSAYVLEPDTWGTWGGALDPEESPEEAARREVVEEAGYHGHYELFPLYVFNAPGGTFRYSNFLAVVDDEFKPHLDWESQGFVWCKWGDWPEPMHFGLQGVLNDPPSVKTIQAHISTEQND